jgi:hypothetical protein
LTEVTRRVQSRAVSVPNAKLPQIEESEQLEHDMATACDVFRELREASDRSDMERLRAAIRSARSWFFDTTFRSGGFHARLSSDLERLNRDATRDDIAIELMHLIGSFPGADLKVRAKMLSADVAAQEPRKLALNIACRRLRRTCRYAPLISEVLAALEATEEIERAWCVLDRVEGLIVQAEKEIADRERRRLEQRQHQLLGQ